MLLRIFFKHECLPPPQQNPPGEPRTPPQSVFPCGFTLFVFVDPPQVLSPSSLSYLVLPPFFASLVLDPPGAWWLDWLDEWLRLGSKLENSSNILHPELCVFLVYSRRF